MDFLEMLEEDIGRSPPDEAHILGEFRSAYNEVLSSSLVLIPRGRDLIKLEGNKPETVARLAAGLTLVYEWCEFREGLLGPRIMDWLRCRNRYLDATLGVLDFEWPLVDNLDLLLTGPVMDDPAGVVVGMMTGWTLATAYAALRGHPDLPLFADNVNEAMQGAAATELAEKIAAVRLAERWQLTDCHSVVKLMLDKADTDDLAQSVALTVIATSGLAQHVLGAAPGLEPCEVLAAKPWYAGKPNEFPNHGRHLDRLLIETA